MDNTQTLNFNISLLDMNLDKTKIVSFLKEQRKRKNLNQKELAEKAGFFQQKVSQLENMTLDFSFDEFNTWCVALDLSPIQVILYTHPMQPLSQDLVLEEEKKQKEEGKKQILEKIKSLIEDVKKM